MLRSVLWHQATAPARASTASVVVGQAGLCSVSALPSGVEVDHDLQLALGRMAGDVALAGRILREYDASCSDAADVTVARLEFYLAREPDHQFTARRVVPIHLVNARRHATKPAARSRQCVRERERRIALEDLSGE